MRLNWIVNYLRLVAVFLITLVCALQITALASHADRIIQNVPYLRQVADTSDDFVGCWACGATSAVMIAAYHNRLDADSNFYVDCCGNHKSEYGKYVSRQYTVAGYTFDTVTKMPSSEQCSDPNAGSPSGADAYGAYGYIHYADGLASPKYARGYFRKHGLFSRIIGNIPSTDEQRNPTIEDVKSEIDRNRPVWASTTLWASGHIVVIVGYTSSGDFIVHDPGLKNDFDCGMGDYKTYSWSDLGVGGKWIVTADKIAVGDRVKALYNVNVRSEPSPSAQTAGDQKTAGDEGVIVANTTGSYYQNSGAGYTQDYTWWRIKWDDGTEGWSAACDQADGDNWIAKKETTNQPTPILLTPAISSFDPSGLTASDSYQYLYIYGSSFIDSSQVDWQHGGDSGTIPSDRTTFYDFGKLRIKFKTMLSGYGSWNFRVKNGAEVSGWKSFSVEEIVPVKGDINGDGDVGISDAILALQIGSGITPNSVVYKSADVNGDGKIGIEEVIYIMQLTDSESYIAPIVDYGLVSYYTFDDDNVKDYSGNRHGQEFGRSSTYEIGKIGRALRLNRDGAYVEIPYSPDLDPEILTISMWIKSYDSVPDIPYSQQTKYIISQILLMQSTTTCLNLNTTTGTYIYTTTYQKYYGTALVAPSHGTGYKYSLDLGYLHVYPSAGIPATNDQWIHIVYTRDKNTNVRVWYNGVEGSGWNDGREYYKVDADNAKNAVLQINPVISGIDQFNGLIDDLRIYNRTLTQAEINELYNLGN